MQLVMMQKLEQALGGNIPIQCFFDLVTGTKYMRFLQPHTLF